jgi:hypothetical protein
MNGIHLPLRRAGLALAITAVALPACSSTSGSDKSPSKLPPVSTSQPVSGLSESDQQQLCDWQAALYGGYGRTLDCADAEGQGEMVGVGPTDQASCVGQFAQLSVETKSCGATVGQFETCLQWDVTNLCVVGAKPPAECAALSDPACLPPGDAGGD